MNLTSDLRGWYCIQCGAKGDASKLAGWVLLGREPRGAEDLRAVRAGCAARGLCAAAPGAPAPRVERRPAPPASPPPRRLEHLPTREVAAFWAASRPLKTDPAALAYLLKRYSAHGYKASDLARLHDVVRAIPLAGFPEWWPEKWTRAYRVVVPAYDATGTIRAVQARNVAVAGFAGLGPKTRWPLALDRYCYSGLVFADKNGAAVLAGRPPSGLRRVLVVEGLTDTIRATLYARRSAHVTAVLGVESGAAPVFRALGRRWPRLRDGAPVPCVMAPDPDPQGAAYLDAVREALPASVPVLEAKW